MKTDTWERKLGRPSTSRTTSPSAEATTSPSLDASAALRTEAWRERLAGFVWLVFGTIEIWIGLRILLRAIGANPENRVASFLYETTAVALAPFEGLTRNPTYDGLVLEIHSLVALLIVGLVGWIAIRSIDVLLPPAPIAAE